MNSIRIAALAVVMSLTPTAIAKADESTIATFSVNAGEENGQLVVADVALQKDGTLVIEKHLYNVSNPYSGVYQSTRLLFSKVSDTTLQLLKSKLIALTAAEIQTTEQKYVCLMMPKFGASRVLETRTKYDWETESLTGALRVVDNNAGCWQKVHTAPKSESDRETAASVESALEVLTIEAVAAQ